MNTIKMTLTLAVAAGALAAAAKTTTFKGTSYSSSVFDFNDAANWDNGAPAAGDTVNISVNGTEWNRWEIFSGSLDIGDAGLTINSTMGFVRLNVSFSGAGKITKAGAGRIGIGVSSTFGGGMDHMAGELEPCASGIAFGTGPIRVYASLDGKPRFSTDGWNWYFTNEINVLGTLEGNYSLIYSGQMWTLPAPLTSETDLQFFFNGTGGVGLQFSDAVSAPGHTLTLATDNTKRKKTDAPNYVFLSTVDASVCLTSCYKLTFKGNSRGIGRDNALKIAAGGGDCVFESKARWAGTNVVVASSTSTLTVNHSQTFPAEVAFDFVSGAKLCLPNNVYVVARSVKVDGVELPEGGYNAANRPDLITGGGALVVVRHGQSYVWKGGAAGNWNVAKNWDPEEVPYNDAFAVFTNSVTLASAASPETVAVGPDGLAIVLNYLNGGNASGYLSFTGSGPLDFVLLASTWLQRASMTDFAGDIRLRGKSNFYSAEATGAYPFGKGTISIYGDISDLAPQLYPDKWGVTVPNDIRVYGCITNTAGLDRGRSGAITTGGSITLAGNIIADNDLLICEGYGNMTIKGSVTVPPGKEIRLYNKNTDPARDKNKDNLIVCYGQLHGNVVAIDKSTRPLVIDAAMTDAGCSLTSLANTNLVLRAGASWAGTNVTVRGGAMARLVLNAAGNLMPYAVVTLADGATAQLDFTGRADVAELWIDGEKMAKGRYSARTMPTRFSGTGTLRVGGPAGAFLIVR